MYYPTDKYMFDFVDYTRGGEEFSNPLGNHSELLKKLGLKETQVAQRMHYSTIRVANGESVDVLMLNEPFDAAPGVAAMKYEEAKINGGILFRDPNKSDGFIQPKPNIVILITKFEFQKMDSKLAEELLKRTPEIGKMSEGMWEQLQEVSGYSKISGHVSVQGDEFIPIADKYRADGHRTTDTHRETLTCWTYASPEQAKQAKDAFEKMMSKLEEMIGEDLKKKGITPKKNTREDRYWTNGSRLYRFSMTEKSKPAEKN
jgi:hypothetical protein